MPNSVMSDSGSSSVGEARMLERRVSNNRADLNGDQQMNYFLAWFNSWSPLQREDFVPILASKMSADGKAKLVNGGLADAMASIDISNGGRPPSLFACQIKLFRDWFGGWSDDQKNYLVVRLRDIDGGFFEAYESYLNDPEGHAKRSKDYFEPGVPAELVRTPTNHARGDSGGGGDEEGDAEEAEEDSLSLKKTSGSGDSSSLSPISEAV